MEHINTVCGQNEQILYLLVCNKLYEHKQMFV